MRLTFLLLSLVLVTTFVAPLSAQALTGLGQDTVQNECTPWEAETGCEGTDQCQVTNVNGVQGYRCVTVGGQISQESPTDGPAEGGGVNTEGGLSNPLKADDIGELLTLVVGGIAQLMTVFLVLALVYTGFLFVFAQGNEEKLKSARQALFWTVVGGILVLGITAISEVLKRTVESVVS